MICYYINGPFGVVDSHRGYHSIRVAHYIQNMSASSRRTSEDFRSRSGQNVAEEGVDIQISKQNLYGSDPNSRLASGRTFVLLPRSVRMASFLIFQISIDSSF